MRNLNVCRWTMVIVGLAVVPAAAREARIANGCRPLPTFDHQGKAPRRTLSL
jgi:hypothetical protein